jgi:GT2 family glycosyltransferase
MKLIVGIPTINRADLLNESLQKYFEDFKDTHIAIVDNGNQQIITRENEFMIYRPHANLGVAGSWNLIMDYGKRTKATHVLMLNDDVYLGKSEHLINMFLISNIEYGFYNSTLNWCSFIMPIDTWEIVGGFDTEFFPAYFEDNSMCYKMRLANITRLNTPFLNPVIYRNSMTIAKDKSLNARFMDNRKTYIEMWGGLPNEEKFTTKFNK